MGLNFDEASKSCKRNNMELMNFESLEVKQEFEKYADDYFMKVKQVGGFLWVDGKFRNGKRHTRRQISIIFLMIFYHQQTDQMVLV